MATAATIVGRKRWLQVSLRALFVLMTLAAVGTAGYLRYSGLARSLAFHRDQLQQQQQVYDMWQRVSFHVPQWAYADQENRSQHHRQCIADAERAWWRPWLPIPALSIPPSVFGNPKYSEQAE